MFYWSIDKAKLVGGDYIKSFLNENSIVMV